ncbi:MAG: hypothetical protein M0Z62_08085 [Actinomycetota bacterium]|nr:hypothetical protein [Actinomycetota bacterium]
MTAVFLLASVAVPLGVLSGGAHPPKAQAATLGNTNCGTISISPSSGLTGGYTYNGTTVAPTQVTVSVNWTATPSTAGCATNPDNCSGFLGGCWATNAGYLLVGLICSTLALTAANPANYCNSTANSLDVTDYNSGPNDPSYSHGTAFNQCTTLATLGGFVGQTVPQCLADGSTGGWTENWPVGSTSGSFTGPIEESASATPWTPAGTNTPATNCPPSQAEIAAGAIPGTCAFVIQEVDINNTGALGTPNPTINAANKIAVPFTYQQTAPGPTTLATTPTVIGDTMTASGSGWGPAVGLSTASGSLSAQVCGLGGVSTTCSANSTVTLTEATNGSGTLTGTVVVGSDIGTQCVSNTCFVKITSNNTQIENGWIGPQTFSSAPFTVLGPPAAAGSTSTASVASVGQTLVVSGTNFDPAGSAATWYLKNATTGATYPSAACPVPGQPQPQGTTVSTTVGATGSFSSTLVLNLCIVPAFAGGQIVAIVTQTSQGGLTLTATSNTISLNGSLSQNEYTPSFDQSVLASQPIGYWTLSEPTGTPAASDSSGNVNAGTYHGAVTLGQVGPLAGPTPPTSATFDGATGYVSTAQEFVDPSTLSMGVWFKTSSPQGVIMGFNNTGTPTPTQYDRMLYVGADGHLEYGVYNGTTNVLSSPGAVDNGAWHYAVATLSTSGTSLYLDGNLVGSGPAITPSAFNGYWVLGASNTAGWPDAPASNFFAGSLADAWVAPTVVGRSSVAAQWGFGAAAQPVAGSYDSIYRQAVLNLGATADWQLSDHSGTSVAEVAGSQLTGSYVGGTTLGKAGPISVNGDTDTSVHFDGVTGGANLPQPLPSTQAAASVAVWFRTGATGVPIVAAQNCAAPCAPSASAPLLWVGSNGDLYGTLGQTPASALNSAVYVADGKWHFAVISASTSGTALYLDGVQRATNAAVPDLANLTHLVLGTFDQTGATWPGLATGSPLFLSGTLAQAALFPIALNAGQGALLYSTALTRYSPGANVEMTPVNLSSPGGTTSFGLLAPVQVVNQTPNTGGWSVTAMFTSNFQNQTPTGGTTNNTIPVTDLLYAPTVLQASGATYQGLGTSGATPTSVGAFQPFQLNVAEPLCSAAGTAVAGSTAGAYANCGAVLQLNVPGTTAVGRYSATMQITVS